MAGTFSRLWVEPLADFTMYLCIILLLTILILRILGPMISATCACTNVPYTVGETCTRQAFCTSGHTCTKKNEMCTELESIADCEAEKETKEWLTCGEGDRWYYYCSCNEGWQGDDCNVEIGMNSRSLFMSIIHTFILNFST